MKANSVLKAARAQVGIVRSNEFPMVSLNPEFSGGKSTQGIKSNIFTLAANGLSCVIRVAQRIISRSWTASGVIRIGTYAGAKPK